MGTKTTAAERGATAGHGATAEQTEFPDLRPAVVVLPRGGRSGIGNDETLLEGSQQK